MGESAFSIDCVSQEWETRSVQSWALATVIAPPCLVAAAFAMWYSRYRCTRQPKYTQTYWPVTNLVILIVMHPLICKGAFSLISCRYIAGRAFLERDMDIACSSKEYYVWIWSLAIPSLLLFGVGIPAYYFMRMYWLRKRKELAMHRHLYGFLFTGYQESCWWFELWNTVRKALFTGFAIMLTPAGPGMQAWGSFALLVISVLVILLIPPYKDDWLNTLEKSALAVDASTLFMGLGLFLNEKNNRDSKSHTFAMIFSIVIAVTNIWFIVYLMYTVRKHTNCAAAAGRCCRKVQSTTSEILCKRTCSRRGPRKSTRAQMPSEGKEESKTIQEIPQRHDFDIHL